MDQNNYLSLTQKLKLYITRSNARRARCRRKQILQHQRWCILNRIKHGKCVLPSRPISSPSTSTSTKSKSTPSTTKRLNTTPASSRLPFKNITSAVVNGHVHSNTSNDKGTQPSLLAGVTDNPHKSLNVASIGVNLEHRFANVNTTTPIVNSNPTPDINHQRTLPHHNFSVDLKHKNFVTESLHSNTSTEIVTQPTLLSGVTQKERKTFNVAHVGVNLEKRFANVKTTTPIVQSNPTPDSNPKTTFPHRISYVDPKNMKVVTESLHSNTSLDKGTQPSLLSGVTQKAHKTFNVASLGVNLQNRFANVNTNTPIGQSNPKPDINPKRKLLDLNFCDDDISDSETSSQTDSGHEDSEEYESHSDSDTEHNNIDIDILPQLPIQGYILLLNYYIIMVNNLNMYQLN
jgi:hypothetical protein